jgi:hypothetical protein
LPYDADAIDLVTTTTSAVNEAPAAFHDQQARLISTALPELACL